jgi:hypothetical protein
MSNRKTSKTTAPAQGLTLQGVPSQLAALQTGLGLGAAVFSRVERKKTRSSSQHVPDALIELVATHAENNSGAVAGLPFDGAAARVALTQVSTAQAAVRAARQFAQRVEDDATQGRATVADRTFAVYSALRRLVRTPEGAALKDTYDQMHTVVRASNKARRAAASGTASATKTSKASATAAAKAPTPTVTPAQAGAPAEANAPAPAPVVAAPAAAPEPVPAAVAGASPAHPTSA